MFFIHGKRSYMPSSICIHKNNRERPARTNHMNTYHTRKHSRASCSHKSHSTLKEAHYFLLLELLPFFPLPFEDFFATGTPSSSSSALRFSLASGLHGLTYSISPCFNARVAVITHTLNSVGCNCELAMPVLANRLVTLRDSIRMFTNAFS